MLVFNSATRLLQKVDSKLFSSAQTVMLNSASPREWKTGLSDRLGWNFKGPSYREFPDKELRHWSYYEHIACNDALDRGLIDVTVEEGQASCCLPNLQTRTPDLRVVVTRNFPTSNEEETKAKGSHIFGGKISKPLTRRGANAGNTPKGTTSVRVRNNDGRRYLATSYQVESWERIREKTADKFPAASSCSEVTKLNRPTPIIPKEVVWGVDGDQATSQVVLFLRNSHPTGIQNPCSKFDPTTPSHMFAIPSTKTAIQSSNSLKTRETHDLSRNGSFRGISLKRGSENHLLLCTHSPLPGSSK